MFKNIKTKETSFIEIFGAEKSKSFLEEERKELNLKKDKIYQIYSIIAFSLSAICGVCLFLAIPFYFYCMDNKIDDNHFLMSSPLVIIIVCVISVMYLHDNISKI